MTTQKCKIENCDKVYGARARKGYCSHHYYLLFRKQYSLEYGRRPEAKERRRAILRKYWESPKGREGSRRWLANYRRTERGKATRCALQAQRNALIKKRTPKWANLDKIKDFYLARPKGCEIDHIVPLQGEIISGLHVENNLQYLSPFENRKKNNSYG